MWCASYVLLCRFFYLCLFCNSTLCFSTVDFCRWQCHVVMSKVRHHSISTKYSSSDPETLSAWVRSQMSIGMLSDQGIFLEPWQFWRAWPPFSFIFFLQKKQPPVENSNTTSCLHSPSPMSNNANNAYKNNISNY